LFSGVFFWHKLSYADGMMRAWFMIPIFLCLALPRATSARQADFILVEKAKRMMTLYAKGKPVKSYVVALGGAPVGHKTTQGDNRTPEGRYRIDFKNNRSQFHLSLRVSYPNAADRAQATRRGVSPGGDIFIHGQPGGTRTSKIASDWTLGCIAVSNAEIEEIWKLVKVGTVVELKP
jgi:murein L,D-transpeptidase YafK